MSSWGGSRPGAGRKAIGNKPKVKRTFSLTESNLDLISDESKRLKQSLSETMDDILTELQPVNSIFPPGNTLSLSDNVKALYRLADVVYMSVSRDPDIEKAKSILDPEREAKLSAHAQKTAQPEPLPLFPDDALAALSKALDDTDYTLSREAFQATGLADNKDQLKYALNKRARAIYAASAHATEAKTAGRHERANKVIEASDALTEIKKAYGGAVAGVLALELVHLDLNFWCNLSDYDKRLSVWRAFQLA